MCGKIPVRSNAATALLLAAALAAAGCASAPPRDPTQVTIAEVAGRSIRLAQFQRILDEAPERASDVIKSRLLDQFLDEQVLLEEAHRRGIRATDPEVDQAAMRLLAEEIPDAAFREELRAALTVEKLLRAIVEETAAVTPEEEQRFYAANPEEFHRPGVYRVRQILMDDEAEAERVHASVLRDPARFAEVAAERSLSPDRGRPLSYSQDALPREVADVVADVQSGQITEVIELSGNYLILLVEEVLAERSLSFEEVRGEIRARLLEQRGSGAMSRLLADLKSRLGVRLHRENLPFRYVTEEPA